MDNETSKKDFTLEASMIVGAIDRNTEVLRQLINVLRQNQDLNFAAAVPVMSPNIPGVTAPHMPHISHAGGNQMPGSPKLDVEQMIRAAKEKAYRQMQGVQGLGGSPMLPMDGFGVK